MSSDSELAAQIVGGSDASKALPQTHGHPSPGGSAHRSEFCLEEPWDFFKPAPRSTSGAGTAPQKPLPTPPKLVTISTSHATGRVEAMAYAISVFGSSGSSFHMF